VEARKNRLALSAGGGANSEVRVADCVRSGAQGCQFLGNAPGAIRIRREVHPLCLDPQEILGDGVGRGALSHQPGDGRYVVVIFVVGTGQVANADGVPIGSRI